MLLKTKLFLSLGSAGVLGGTGSGVYYGMIKDKQELEIEKKTKTETEELEKQKKITENKKIVDDLFTECKASIMKDTNSTWESLYDPTNLSAAITFDCGSKQVIMNISGNPENDYRKIVDTTDRWWSGKTKNFIVFEISQKDTN